MPNMTTEPFLPQIVRPRPMQYETPESYLTRICDANIIDTESVKRRVQSRRYSTRNPYELGVVIEELGGPPRSHFEREFERATGQLHTGEHAFRPNPATRPGCIKCCAGTAFDTFDHRRHMTCLKHYRWLGTGHHDPPHDVPHTICATERHFRRISVSAAIPMYAFDDIGEACRHRKTPTTDATSWCLDHVGNYRMNVSILRWMAIYIETRFGDQRPPYFWHRGTNGADFRAYLRERLAPAERHYSLQQLIEDLVYIADVVLSDRDWDTSVHYTLHTHAI